MHKAKRQIIAWLKRNDGWHYGTDIAAAAKISRATVYIHLDYLQDHGLIEGRQEPAPWPYQDKGAQPRSQYRYVRGDDSANEDEPTIDNTDTDGATYEIAD